VIEAEIAELTAFEDFRRHVEREAAYLEAWAREQRKTERNAAEELRKHEQEQGK